MLLQRQKYVGSGMSLATKTSHMILQCSHIFTQYGHISLLIFSMALYSLDNLIARYEEPSSMVRWDSPLITISWTDEDIPQEKIWLAAIEGTAKTPNAGTSTVCTSVYEIVPH